MDTFKLKQEGFKEIRKGLIKHSIRFAAILIILNIIAFFIQMGMFRLLCITILVFQIFNEIKNIYKTKEAWMTFLVSMNEETIYKNQIHKQEVAIDFADITGAVEIPLTGLYIESFTENKYIFIPRALENYEDFKEKLNKKYYIQIASKNIKNSAMYTALMMTRDITSKKSCL